MVSDQQQQQDPNDPNAVTRATIPFEPKNDGNMQLEVAAPVLVKDSLSSYHTYPITGRDSNGPIECQRRFNMFYEFRQVLLIRFAGLYVPPVSPKQVTGKGNELTLLERQFFLDQFLKQCCKLKYIAQSNELQVFLKTQVQVEKELDKLKVRCKTHEHIDLLRACVAVNENYEAHDLKTLEEDTSEFIRDQQQLMVHLQSFLGNLAAMVPIKKAERDYYTHFSAFLEKYEETKMRKSARQGELAHVQLISGDQQEGLKHKLSEIGTSFQNPFIHISNWVKGEVLTLDALIKCVEQIQNIEAMKRKTIEAIKDTEDTIRKLNSGQFTFSGMLKDDSGKKQLALEKDKAKLELEADVVNFDVIKKILTIYMATVAIPDFQKNAKARYVIAMGNMCCSEVHNASTIVTCWDAFKHLIDSYGIKY